MSTTPTARTAHAPTETTTLTPERRERALDRREARDPAVTPSAADASAVDMHGYDDLPFTD